VTTILTGIVGSHSYGTATPASDYDYMSIILAPPEVYLGLDNWGNSGTKEEKFDDPVQGPTEHRYFELKKAIQMATDFNPNFIPLLWLDQHHYTKWTMDGAYLIRNRQVFNSKKAYHTFCGYAHSQLQKMGGIFNDQEEANKELKEGHIRFQEWANKAILEQRLLRVDDKAYDSGYLNALIALRTHSKEECKRIKDGPITGRMGAKRKELREKYGYDTKFAFHTIRLMRMCNEFLAHPEKGLKVWRVGIDADELFAIREGRFTQEQIKAMADELFAQARELVAKTDLPDEPDHKAINDMTMDIIRSNI
jgi:uncharacterized protein